jgi:hypothetical protein
MIQISINSKGLHQISEALSKLDKETYEGRKIPRELLQKLAAEAEFRYNECREVSILLKTNNGKTRTRFYINESGYNIIDIEERPDKEYKLLRRLHREDGIKVLISKQYPYISLNNTFEDNNEVLLSTDEVEELAEELIKVVHRYRKFIEDPRTPKLTEKANSFLIFHGLEYMEENLRKN